MNYRPAVLVIFQNNEGKVLIGSSPRDGGFKFVQGGIDNGETPIDAAIREAKEEIGIEIAKADIIYVANETVKYTFPPERAALSGYEAQEMHVFVIQFDGNSVPLANDEEFEELFWIYPQDLGKFDTKHRTPGYKDALRICGFLPKME